jgi:hypothetical protein
MTEERHCGYRNYETFSVAVMIDNDRHLLAEARLVTAHALLTRGYRFEACDRLRAWFEERFTDWVTEADRDHNIASTFVTTCLGAVDWLELLEEWEKEEGQ